MVQLLTGSLALPLAGILRAADTSPTQTAAPSRDAARTDSLQQDGVSATFSRQNGHITDLQFGKQHIDMFNNAWGGPAFRITDAQGRQTVPALVRQPEKAPSFAAQQGDLAMSISYGIEQGALAATVTVANKGKTIATPDSLDLTLGIDTCMISHPQWNTKHFPTFLRCEKTHFWGYAMSPEGSILGIFSPDAVPSWSLNYNNGGHRINGINLNLLVGGPLPARSPQTSNELKPGEQRTWKIYLVPVPSLKEVPAYAARYTGASYLTADRYTVEPGEQINLHLTGNGTAKIAAQHNGADIALPSTEDGTIHWQAPKEPGFYRITVENGKGKTSEAVVTVRHPWSWYMDGSRTWTVKAKQKAGSHVEGWYGFFPSFKWRHLNPDKELDAQIDKDFNELFPTMYDYATMKPTAPALPHRIQNHACAASLFMERYRITGDIQDLERAAKLCDFILATQKPDGAYRSGRTHYTCVIYPAKSIMEVMLAEQELAHTSPVWKERFERHRDSVRKAVDELALHLDNIETEGEMTFEDGMISCSYTQLAAWARHFALPEERAKYIEAAEKLVEKHRCLSQLVQPDSRMNNSSLRFWESQYDVLWCKNMIGSPHGWTAWRLYGLFDLYRLTGKTDYLQQAMNGLGACANLLNPETGELAWAFMVDPRIHTDVFKPDPANPGKGIRSVEVVGETYIPMISQWWKAPYATPVFGYNYHYGVDHQGGSCDNDVHEIFKCLAEHALQTTWLILDEQGNPTVWNGKVRKEGNTWIVMPSEKYVSEVHINTAIPASVKVEWQQGSPKTENVSNGITSLLRR